MIRDSKVDLSKYAGFPLWLGPDSRGLEFGNEVVFEKRIDKTTAILSPVLEQGGETEKKDMLVYSVWRGLTFGDDKKLWQSANLRYDLTLMPAGKFGREFPKTFGHVHIGLGIELYQVLHGRVYSLLDKWENEVLVESVMVEAGEGEIFAVMPGWGHVTINPFEETLVLANVIPLAIEQDYSLYEKSHGGSHYVVASELSKDWIDILANPNISPKPALRKERAALPEQLKFLKNKPLYKIVEMSKTRPDRVAWLKNQ